MLQEATVETYFPFWEVILHHREVVKFVCGLMADPRSLVDHVYTALIEHVLEKGSYIPDRSLFVSLYQESAVILPGSPFHNQHINYYNHDYDDRQGYPRDATPVFTPCKLYVFDSMKEDVTLEHRTSKIGVLRGRDSDQAEPNSSDTQECTIWIHGPDKSLEKRLLSLCQTISTSQAVTDFKFIPEFLHGCELSEANVPAMGIEAKSLVLMDIQVSSRVWKKLLQHESLEVLHLHSVCLHGEAVPLIFNHRNLEVLNLWGADMSLEMWQYVCHHLGDLVHLENIDRSYNDLSRVSSIRLSNTTSPVTLKLTHTYISPELFKSICQLTSVMKLKELDLSGNTLTGSLHQLLSEPWQRLQYLEELNLEETELNKNDIEALTRAVQRHMLPELYMLDLKNNNLHRVEKETEELIQTCITHRQRELRLWHWHNGLSEEIQEKWKRLCRGTHIKISDFVLAISSLHPENELFENRAIVAL